MWRMLERMAKGDATKDEVDMLGDVTNQIAGHTICAFGEGSSWPVQGLLRHFKKEIEKRNNLDPIVQKKNNIPLRSNSIMFAAQPVLSSSSTALPSSSMKDHYQRQSMRSGLYSMKRGSNVHQRRRRRRRVDVQVDSKAGGWRGMTRMGLSAIYGMLAGVYHWFPKLYGKVMNKRMGMVHFWVTIVCGYGVFLPMHFLGEGGLPRRY